MPIKELKVNVGSGAPKTSAADAPLPSGWFSADQVQTYRDAEDENQLARAITAIDPAAGREEILFRYKLSKTVYLREFDLPLLPASAMQILQLGQDPNAGANDYLEVIQSDPALASEVVRTSNSALFARSLLLSSTESSNMDLDEAIVRLGVNEIEKLAMLHSFNAKLFRVPGHGSLVDEVIQHGVTVSFAAQAVAEEIRVSPTEAFLAGLFHDAGKLILLGTVAEVQKKLKWVAPIELIDSAFDAFHTVVGALTCEKWDLPDVITEAVRSHHSPDEAASSPISQAAYLGNRIGHFVQTSDAGANEQQPAWTDDPVVTASGISVDRLEGIVAEVSAKLAAVGNP